MATTPNTATSVERSDLLQTLATHRHFLRFTVRDLSDEQAAMHPTASALCLGGLIKHVAFVESGWAAFIVGGAVAMAENNAAVTKPTLEEGWSEQFQMQPDETLAGILEHYQEVARRTDELVSTVADLDQSHPLPEAPWFEKGAQWSARRVLLHILAETAEHAGHADIIRESIDGGKTMG